MTIGEKIYKLRNEAHMTQEDLAGRMGVSRQSVSKWESGASVPELEKLKMIAELFQVSVEELINPDAEKKTIAVPKKKAEELPEMSGPSEENNQWEERIASLEKEVKHLNRVSWIRLICIILLSAVIVINAVSSISMSRRITRAQETADNASGGSVVYMSSDSDESDSVFQDYYEEIKSLDADNHTMLVDFTVVPESTTADTRVSVVLTNAAGEDTVVELQDTNSRYTAEAELPICAYPNALILMEDADGRQTYVAYFDSLAYLDDALLPQLQICAYLLGISWKNYTLSGTGTLEVNINLDPEGFGMIPPLEEAAELDQLTLRIRDYDQYMEDGTILWEQTMTEDQREALRKGETVTLELDLEADCQYTGLCIEVALTNHVLQEEKIFSQDVYADGMTSYILLSCEDGLTIY